MLGNSFPKLRARIRASLLLPVVTGMWLAGAARAQLNPPIAGATNAARAAKPWGELKIQRIPLEKSDFVFLDRAMRLKTPAWHFENFSPPQLVSFLESCNLSPSVHDDLLQTNRWIALSNACDISPSHDLILKLNPAERARLFAVLGRSETNYAQRWPFRMPLNGFDERFACANLPKAKLELVRSLTYTNGNQLCFCNFGTLKAFVTDDEFNEIVEALYAVPAVLVRVHVTPDSDVNALVKYWGRGGREQRIRPLIESVAHMPAGEDLNVSFLLPQFARVRLYVFPDPDGDVTEAKTDCFYTAFNFFSAKADDRFLDPQVRRQTLQNEYAPIRGQPLLGDLVTLINRKGNIFHVAVYIAQDIVFTKNGENYLQPWVLMRMDDLLAFYGTEVPVRMIIYRRKDL